MCRKKKKITEIKEPYTTQMFIRDLEELLQICVIEKEQLQNDSEDEYTVGVLNDLTIPELSKLKMLAEAGSLPPKGERWISSTGLIIDCWDECPKEIEDRLFHLSDNYKNNLD